MHYFDRTRPADWPRYIVWQNTTSWLVQIHCLTEHELLIGQDSLFDRTRPADWSRYIVWQNPTRWLVNIHYLTEHDLLIGQDTLFYRTRPADWSLYIVWQITNCWLVKIHCLTEPDPLIGQDTLFDRTRPVDSSRHTIYKVFFLANEREMRVLYMYFSVCETEIVCWFAVRNIFWAETSVSSSASGCSQRILTNSHKYPRL